MSRLPTHHNRNVRGRQVAHGCGRPVFSLVDHLHVRRPRLDRLACHLRFVSVSHEMAPQNALQNRLLAGREITPPLFVLTAQLSAAYRAFELRYPLEFREFCDAPEM